MKKGVIINQDNSCLYHYIGTVLGTRPPVAEDFVNHALQYKDSQVSDYFICLNAGIATYPSKTLTSIVDKYHQKFENGLPVDYTKTTDASSAHYIYEVLGIDHIAIQIDTFRKIGINPWLSFRMNDVHDYAAKADLNLSEFFHDHPETRRVKFHPEFIHTNCDFAYDYTHESVRDLFKAFIDESLDRYDAYGIELDFQREIKLFAIGYEYDGIELLNGFLRDIDAITHKYEEKYGHQIKLAVRVAPDVQINFDYGLDVMQWVQEGIVDTVILAPRFESTDMDIPVRMWKTLLRPYGTELVAGIEIYIQPNPGMKPLCPNIETFAAIAANAYSQGADKIYFFNYFRCSVHDLLTDDIECSEDPDLVFSDDRIYKTVISKLGSFEDTLALNRHHIITIKDRLPLWKRNTNYAAEKRTENRAANQLPLRFNRDGSFKLAVGKIHEDSEVTLRFAVDDHDAALASLPRVFVNSEACDYIGDVNDPRWYPEGKLLCYKIPQTAYKDIICPYIIVSGETLIRYVDALIKVKK